MGTGLQHLSSPVVGIFHVSCCTTQPSTHGHHRAQHGTFHRGLHAGILRFLQHPVPLSPHGAGHWRATPRRFTAVGFFHEHGLCHGFGECARPFLLFDVHVAAYVVGGGAQNAAGTAVHQVADHLVFHRHGGHLAQQRHQDFHGQCVGQRPKILASGQPLPGHCAAVAADVGRGTHGMEPL